MPLRGSDFEFDVLANPFADPDFDPERDMDWTPEDESRFAPKPEPSDLWGSRGSIYDDYAEMERQQQLEDEREQLEDECADELEVLAEPFDRQLDRQRIVMKSPIKRWGHS